MRERQEPEQRARYHQGVKRRAMQILFAFGLLLMLAAGTLWVRGFWIQDIFFFTWYYDRSGESAGGLQVRSNARTLILWVERRLGPTRDGPVRFHFDHLTLSASTGRRFPQDTFLERLGFYHEKNVVPGIKRVDFVSLPSWLPVVACASVATIPAARLVRRWRQRKRRARGLCPKCGYDLRGAAHERCPECGEPVSHAHHGKMARPHSLSPAGGEGGGEGQGA